MRKFEEGNSPYMPFEVKASFKDKLLKWRDELILDEHKAAETINEVLDKAPDHIDAAASEAILETDILPKISRDQKLVNEINEALARIENGTYGYCEESGMPIGIKRLEAWPIARLCIEIQEEIEGKGQY